MMPGPFCENCGFAEGESENIGRVRDYFGVDSHGAHIVETLCEFCASAEIAADIPHELVQKERE